MPAAAEYEGAIIGTQQGEGWQRAATPAAANAGFAGLEFGNRAGLIWFPRI
jgi:hypothetical protein